MWSECDIIELKKYRQSFAAHWGEGTTSSSDGQRFKVGGHAEKAGQINPKSGSEPSVQFYTHISDQYRSIPSLSMLALEMLHMSLMVFYIINPICASKNITPIRQALMIMYLP
jgi:TnpA family transposase